MTTEAQGKTGVLFILFSSFRKNMSHTVIVLFISYIVIDGVWGRQQGGGSGMGEMDERGGGL